MAINLTPVAPKVSIIIPVYNLESLISRSIECSINQTFTDIEIIIVNDGSADNSEEVIAGYRAKDKRIKYIRKSNEGLTLARKTGVEASSGDFIFHFDGDDTIPSDTIENLYRSAIKHGADIVAGNILTCKPGEPEEEGRYADFGVGTSIAFLEYILINKLHFLWGKLIKRSLYVAHNLIMVTETKVVPAEDQVQMYQLCMFASKVATISNNVYHYRINSTSITQRPIKNEVFTSQQEIYAQVMTQLLQTFSYNTIICHQLNYRILLALYLALHRTGHYVVHKKTSRLIMWRTILNSVFSKKTLLFTHGPLLARCTAVLIFPKARFYFKDIFQQ